ncbi:gliding motility lipoprotein GldH [Cellulophaga baltica]|uniref:Gliding motility protein n=1 Tax=Cellulophaga baltica 18 TaxID=1348584 RepID=A0AAU8RY69_9FLAO|nr:gliding motility lipoprotein GldH [Cellulophaga baltica]AIZ41014.1 gliding motility protein [Cellulophaga baltica 18]WFO18174.1 gliding motility lipoprotein GldH [Cellulophaga baltica 4]
MAKYLFCFLSLVLLASCDTTTVSSEYKSTPNGNWDKDDIKEFQITELDSTQHYDIFINLRNDEKYAYSNIFLIAELEYPNGASVKDTLEYEMTLPDGQWLGKGSGSIKESKLWYKENIVLPVKGVYNLKIAHAMRKNGRVEGIVDLEGITDVGYKIEKHQ